MCILIRAFKTIQNITQITGQNFATAVLIGIDTIFFLLVFKNLLTDDLTLSLLLVVVFGFIAGFYLGAFIEEKIALGLVNVNIRIAKEKSKDLFNILNENGFVFVRSKRVHSHKGKLRKIYSGIVYRKELPKLKELIEEFNAVCVIENVKSTFGKKILTSEEYLKREKNKLFYWFYI